MERRCELNSTDSEQCLVTGSFEHGNKPFGSTEWAGCKKLFFMTQKSRPKEK
jgi:hypothetical protein